jgi:ABC-type multidrug transport system fused ATPase/permease subunit
MILDITPAVLISTAVMFIVGFAILFVIYYFTSPFSARFDDRNSRIVYSLVNALYFSVVLSIGFAVLPGLSSSYGIIVALLVGLVIVFVFTAVQVYAISELVKRGILRMHSKSSGEPKVEPKGKR